MWMLCESACCDISVRVDVCMNIAHVQHQANIEMFPLTATVTLPEGSSCVLRAINMWFR